MSLYPNPIGTDGFSLIEFTGPDCESLRLDLKRMGFALYGRHRTKAIEYYRQGDITLFVNTQRYSHAARFAEIHKTSVSSMGFVVQDSDRAFDVALQRGATELPFPMEARLHDWHALSGIGGSAIYLVTQEALDRFLLQHFDRVNDATPALGLISIDHLTHNVFPGQMDVWAKFYEDVFNFREIRFFDIDGQHTGLVSRAMCSPCGFIKIPLNESKDEHSQISEYLREYDGEGIQHIAFSTNDIVTTVGGMVHNGIGFLDVPDTYYRAINERIPDHQENIEALRPLKILMDGGPSQGGGLLLQIFTKNMLGPVFFEIIQRKGNEGFGEGNFQALFDAIERDQMERGTLKVDQVTS